MMDQIEELLATFRSEAEDQIDQLGGCLDALRSGPDDQVATLILDVSRLAHNLKGGARSVGEDALAARCHELEDALEPFQDPPVRPPEEVLDHLVELLTIIQRMAEQGLALEATDELLERLGVKEDHTDEPEAPPKRRTAASIRVDTERLDRLMSHASELLVVHAKLLAKSEHLKASSEELQKATTRGAAAHDDILALSREIELLAKDDRRMAQQFGYLSQDINQAMKQIRMLPLERLAPSWRRTVRDCGQDLGKQVSLSVEVGGIEIDRYVLDLLRDPLIHLLRNAVAHGIELPENRRAAGKTARGQVAVRAELQGSVVQLEVSDDGAGMDLDGLVETAVARGLVDATSARELNAAERLDLPFAAGLSSARDVSRISGRGVGLDVVRQNAEKLGGDVQIAREARLGGVTFLVRVPVSLLSTVGLLVTAGGATFALPIEYVVRSFAVPSDQIHRLESGPVVSQGDDEPIRLAWLAELLGMRRPTGGQRITVLTLSRGSRRMGLVVEGIVGEKEFVTKPLPWNLKQVPGVSGAIILPDGSLAPVLDVGALFSLMPADGVGAPVRRSAVPANQARRVLVVDDSLTSRVLERNMLASAGFRVNVAVDGAEAWKVLQKERFDLLVSDVQMPNLDGFALTRRIRKTDRLKELPVVLVTQLGKPEDVARGAEAGADEYIVKGKYDQQLLLEAVGRLL